LGSKESTALLPVFIFLYEWYFFQNLEPKWLKRQLKYLVAIGILSSVVAGLYLGFDHAFTINYQETSIHHFLHQGWLWLEVSDDAGTIVSKDSPSLTYTMEGVMSDECTLESEGTMKPSAHGTCENGVVSLFITENYQPLKGEMVCIDDDGDVYRMPFESPPSVQTHEGENGIGEIFYLVEGSEGYSSMRPFLEGDGYHTWTLYTDDMPVVPLAP